MFFICASSDRAQDVQFLPPCASVNIKDNDGIIIERAFIATHSTILLQSHLLVAVAEFQFSQPSYNVSEDSGEVSVCLELVRGILTEDVVVQVSIGAGLEEMAGCKFSRGCNSM